VTPQLEFEGIYMIDDVIANVNSRKEISNLKPTFPVTTMSKIGLLV
jgi:hypothetical protein